MQNLPNSNRYELIGCTIEVESQIVSHYLPVGCNHIGRNLPWVHVESFVADSLKDRAHEEALDDGHHKKGSRTFRVTVCIDQVTMEQKFKLLEER